MRILFVGMHFPRPNNPTIGTWALSQMQALKDLGHEVMVISPVAFIPKFLGRILHIGTSSLCPDNADWLGIKAVYPKWFLYPVGPLGWLLKKYPSCFVSFAWFWARNKITKIAVGFRPDVIFSHHAAYGGFVASKLADQLGAPYFVTDHSFGEIETCKSNLNRKLHYEYSLRSVKVWFAVANRMQKAMVDIFPGVKSHTLYNGADLISKSFFDTVRPDYLNGKKVVLCVSFFYKRKNIPLLIKAFDCVAENNPDAVLVIGGDGDDRDAVFSAIKSTKFSRRIFALGAMSHNDVLQYMVWCDLFAHIGVNEPFATVFSEAMMAAKPIIYSTDGGISDVVTHGVEGLGVEPNSLDSAISALNTLLKNDTLRESMASNAYELATNKLTWRANALNLVDSFN